MASGMNIKPKEPSKYLNGKIYLNGAKYHLSDTIAASPKIGKLIPNIIPKNIVSFVFGMAVEINSTRLTI